jgi:predicted DNA-binding transcriptional regulator YafY
VASDKLSWIRSMWRYARIMDQEPPDADGWIKLLVQFEVENEACQYVLSFGPQAEVLEPPELRAKIMRLAQEVVALYAKTSDSFDKHDNPDHT